MVLFFLTHAKQICGQLSLSSIDKKNIGGHIVGGGSARLNSEQARRLQRLGSWQLRVEFTSFPSHIQCMLVCAYVTALPKGTRLARSC